MKVLRTTKCRRYGHPEFRVSYDPAVVVVADDVEWFIGWLQDSVAEGTWYKAGETCQIGWVLVQVRQHDGDELTFYEPDMGSFPIEWTEGVTSTLSQLRRQKDVVESVLGAEEVSFPSLRQSAIVCTRLGQYADMILERTNPEGLDSGWFCGCREDDHDHNNVAELRKVSLYEAAVRYAPQIVPYLAFPPGVLVALCDDAPVIFHHGEPLEFLPGSYLAARYRDQ